MTESLEKVERTRAIAEGAKGQGRCFPILIRHDELFRDAYRFVSYTRAGHLAYARARAEAIVRGVARVYTLRESWRMRWET